MKTPNEIFILVGCEESQAITIALRAKGFQAFSCDLLPCSGGHPEWHIQGDVFNAIDGGTLKTQSGNSVFIYKWHGGIFHPTCTYLTNSGVRWLYPNSLSTNPERWSRLVDAMEFFNKIKKHCRINRILHYALENPIPHKYARDGFGLAKGIGKYDQLIQPYQFGHLEKKATCLWLTGFPQLKHTNNVYDEMMKLDYKDRAKIHYASPGPERAKIRSKTYSGIAEAIADQYGDFLVNNL